ncbi:hypothetical protein ANN_06785 [Periplaneta americana]|uniref:Endonuclease/exonuclease/phosphatase domain-containing protein n=1 Tax=Periplaneta americana TaxID=6978 RepID=A0ABQ8TEG7_PERAM|nr:hypothetical protein ANN_06785 [Periplaneta americana]
MDQQLQKGSREEEKKKKKKKQTELRQEVKILQKPNRNDRDEIEIQTAEPFIPEPTLSEVEIAIENLKKYKSPGIDQIPAELIQEGGSALYSEIYKLVLAIWEKEIVPEQWKEKSRQESWVEFVKRLERDVTGAQRFSFKVSKKLKIEITDKTEGLLLVDIIPHGTTINSDGYVATLKKLQARLSRVRRHRKKQDVLLLHDNAQPNDRIGKRGGGVAIYVRSDLPFKIVYQSSNEVLEHPEYLFIEVGASNKKCLLGVVYKPPKSGFLSDLETPLLNLVPHYDHTVILGDFNTNLLNSSNYATVQLKNMFESYNISILPSAATHHTQESETLLDIIATTNPQLALTNGQLPAPGISAHDIIFLEYSLYCPKYKPHITSYRDLKHIEHDKLINDALSLPWTEVWNLPDIDDKIEKFNDLVIQLYDKHAPLKTRRVGRRPAPWMCDAIKLLMTDRDTAYRKYRRSKDELDFNTYKVLRNKCNQAVRNAKLRHAHSLLYLRSVRKNCGVTLITWV